MVRLGQNFLADPNLLDAIVARRGASSPADVVLEVGGGEGVLTERLAAGSRTCTWSSSTSACAPALERVAGAAAGNVNLRLGRRDADRPRRRSSRRRPRMVANLPYSIATPLLLRTIAELPTIGSLDGDGPARDRRAAARRARLAHLRLAERGRPARLRGALLRTVDPAVFKPRPRVESALLRAAPTGPARRRRRSRSLVRDAFAHRRKSLARSLELAARRARRRRSGRASRRRDALGEVRHRCREALAALGLPEDARAEMLTPPQHLRARREGAGRWLSWRPAKLNLCLYLGADARGRAARAVLAVRAARARRPARGGGRRPGRADEVRLPGGRGRRT